MRSCRRPRRPATIFGLKTHDFRIDEPEVTRALFLEMQRAFHEDLEVFAAQQQSVLQDPNKEEVNCRADRAQLLNTCTRASVPASCARLLPSIAIASTFCSKVKTGSCIGNTRYSMTRSTHSPTTKSNGTSAEASGVKRSSRQIFIGNSHRVRLTRMDTNCAIKATDHQLARLIYAMHVR